MSNFNLPNECDEGDIELLMGETEPRQVSESEANPSSSQPVYQRPEETPTSTSAPTLETGTEPLNQTPFVFLQQTTWITRNLYNAKDKCSQRCTCLFGIICTIIGVLLFFGVTLPPIIESQTSTPEVFRHPIFIYSSQGNSTPIITNNDLLRVNSDHTNSICIKQVGSRSYPFTVFDGSCGPTETYTKSFSTDVDIGLRNTLVPIFDNLWLQKDANLSISIDIMPKCKKSCISVYLLTSENIKCLDSGLSIKKCGCYREFTSEGTIYYNISERTLLESGTLTPGYYSMRVLSQYPSEVIETQWSYNITSSYYVFPESSRNNPMCSITDQVCKIFRHNLNEYDGKCLFIFRNFDSNSPQMLRYEIDLGYYWLNSNNIPKLIGYIVAIITYCISSVILVVFLRKYVS